jgi:hypothetical protein
MAEAAKAKAWIHRNRPEGRPEMDAVKPSMRLIVTLSAQALTHEEGQTQQRQPTQMRVRVQQWHPLGRYLRKYSAQLQQLI